jgi:hypothetical protein
MGRTGYQQGDCNYKPKHTVITISTSTVDSKKRHCSEAEEWLYRLAKDPKQYEKRYIDSIKEMTHMIDEVEKIREETPATDHFIHAEIVKARNYLINMSQVNVSITTQREFIVICMTRIL